MLHFELQSPSWPTGFPGGGSSGKESACQFSRHGFNPWVRKIPWRRKWQSTPLFLPGKSHGQRSLTDYSPWGHKELDTTQPSLTHLSDLNEPVLNALNGLASPSITLQYHPVWLFLPMFVSEPLSWSRKDQSLSHPMNRLSYLFSKMIHSNFVLFWAPVKFPFLLLFPYLLLISLLITVSLLITYYYFPGRKISSLRVEPCLSCPSLLPLWHIVHKNTVNILPCQMHPKMSWTKEM